MKSSQSKGLLFKSLLCVMLFSSQFASGMLFDEQSSCDDNGMCVIASITIILEDAQDPSSSSDENSVTSFTIDPETGEEIVTKTVFEEVVETNNRSCTKEVKVPVQLYRTIMSVLGGISNPDSGDHAPTLNPTQQSILLLYNSFLQLVQNFDCTAPTENSNDDEDRDTIVTDIPLPQG